MKRKNQAAHLLIWYKENQALSLLKRSHNLRKQVRSCSGSMHSLSHWPSTPERSVVKWREISTEKQFRLDIQRHTAGGLTRQRNIEKQQVGYLHPSRREMVSADPAPPGTPYLPKGENHHILPPLTIRWPCQVLRRQNGDSQGSEKVRWHQRAAPAGPFPKPPPPMSNCQQRPGTQHSVTFFLFFSIFPSFFLSTSLCFANRIKTLTKISFSEEKHFYRTRTATCFAANTQLKAGKENIYKIQGFFFPFLFFFCTMLKGLFRIFNLINRRSTLCIGIWCIIVF